MEMGNVNAAAGTGGDAWEPRLPGLANQSAAPSEPSPPAAGSLPSIPSAALPTPLPCEDLSPALRESEALLDCIGAMTGAMRGAYNIQARIDRWMVSVAAHLSRISVFRHQDVFGGISVVSEEIAMSMGISRIIAERYVKVGRAVENHLQDLGEAMEAGLVGLDKAWAIVDALGAAPAEVAILVEERVLPRAPERTPSELRRDVQRALVEVDPLGADTRHERATARRGVGRPRMEADGMASMKLMLPAHGAVTLDAALDACAAAARRGGDSRTSGQLRADALTVWATGLLRDGWTWNSDCSDSSPLCCRGGARAMSGPPAAGTIAGTSGIAPAGPLNVAISAGGSSVFAAGTGGIAPVGLLGFDAGVDERDGRAATGGVSGAAGRSPDTGTPVRPVQVGPVPAAVKVTVPLEVLAQALPGWTPPPTPMDELSAEMAGTDIPGPVGRCDAPWLEGYGPIAPAVARLLAAGGTWRRIVTDTVTGAPLDVGRERYSPPPQIAEAVRLRDPVCARPGCSIPSGRCELDHVIPWHLGGTTSLHNLAPLCPRCHRIKTVGGGKESHMAADGTRTWTSASGHGYASLPERDPRLWRPDGLAPGSRGFATGGSAGNGRPTASGGSAGNDSHTASTGRAAREGPSGTSPDDDPPPF